jgi:hypothetical protein
MFFLWVAPWLFVFNNCYEFLSFLHNTSSSGEYL